MKTAISTDEISEFMSGHFALVFKTMLSIEAVSLGQIASPLRGERISGCVAFEGDHVGGFVYLHFSPHLAVRVAAAMLRAGPGAPAIPQAKINDVVGELTNMIGAGFKSWLCDEGAPCAMSVPAISRGTAFDVVAAPGLQPIYILFDCETEQALFEVRIGFN